jgi:hypothetical protein
MVLSILNKPQDSNVRLTGARKVHSFGGCGNPRAIVKVEVPPSFLKRDASNVCCCAQLDALQHTHSSPALL